MANIYDMADTWNDGATTFTAIKMNVTDTASDASSLLMDLQVGGSSKFSVDKNGNALLGRDRLYEGSVEAFNYGIGLFLNGIYYLQTRPFSPNGTAVDIRNAKNVDLNIGGASTSNPKIFMGNNLILTKDAADTLAQRNGTNAQTFNLYNTYTDASNYERGFIKWNSNVLEIGTEAAGSVSTNGIILFKEGSRKRVQILADGRVDFAAPNLVIGASFNGNGLRLKQLDGNNTFQFSAPRLEFDNSLTVNNLSIYQRAGMIARVTDGDSGLTHGQTVVNSGAGATPYLVWYNGTNWTVIGA